MIKLSTNFDTFSKLNFFTDFCKKSSIQAENDPYMKQYHLIRTLQQISHLYSFWKNSSFVSMKFIIFFPKKSYFARFEKFYIFNRILWQVSIAWCEKSFKVQAAEHRTLSHMGNYQLAKTLKDVQLWRLK